MAYVEQGLVGAFRQTWRKGNPRSLLKTLINKNPKADEQKIHNLFWDEIEGDRELLRACVEYWLDNNYRSLIREVDVPPQHASTTPAHRSAAVTEVKEKLEHRVQNEARVILLDLIMPNGQRLGDCTGARCATFGGFYAQLAKKVPSNKTVQSVFKEDDLQKLWRARK